MMNIRTFLLLALAAVSSLFSTQKAVLFNDTSAWYHWGCTGTSLALKEQIQKLGFEIEAFSIGTVYSLQEVPPFGDFDDLKKFERFQEANKEVLAAILNADADRDRRRGGLSMICVLGPQSASLFSAYFHQVFRKACRDHQSLRLSQRRPMSDLTAC